MGFVDAQNLVIDFPVFSSPSRSLKNTVLNATTGGRLASGALNRMSVRAIDDVTFRLDVGDRLGLVGHNGSGKTTLLRALAGAYEPSAGRLKTKGRVISLLDVSMGMEHEATGFENIFLRGVMMGLSTKEINERVAGIAEFSELGEYLSMPIRTYSSGMMLRLAFAVSTSVPADILLMDEWLSVGDAAFNEKAAERLKTLVDNASILIMATHSQTLLNDVCNKAFTLEKGRITDIFTPNKLTPR